MTVLYRALWSAAATNNPDVVISESAGIASAWAKESADLLPLPEGRTELQVSQGRHRSVSYRSIGTDAFEMIVDDQNPDEETDWTTVIRIVRDGDEIHSLVENRIESADVTRRVSIGRPKFVHDLLVAADKPRLGDSALLTAPQDIPAHGIDILTQILANPDRSVPVVVCSEPFGHHDGSWRTVAARIASRAEGIAVVITLDRDAVLALKQSLEALAIWGGGIRVYAPVPVSAGSDGWRHRYYLRDRIESSRQAIIDRIVYSLAQLSARRRVPKIFDIFVDQSETSTVSASELDDAREKWEFELDLALERTSELEKELATANGHLARLKEVLIASDLGDLLWGTKDEDTAHLPDEVQDTSEAVLAAQTYLMQWLSIPESAARELEGIDTTTESYSWGNTAWRGLRALAAYAQDRGNGWNRGGFWEWCASGPIVGWPANTKKLSMSEGETVQNNDKLKRARVFEIDAAVDPSGQITMLAHLKIAEGGGSLAPRVYFHDDTGGNTGRVHIGFVGPHYLVPNKSTN